MRDKAWEQRGTKSKLNQSDTKSHKGGGNAVQCYYCVNESAM